ncbi:Phox homologous domain [Pseudocohnilembus persalinus]|uniref:Phox homologous domain n=1 Tax=Pseudocohnilembus persalinus TaxID=266149 RepID=A0A0V0R3E6_PSEPJ|nr:Phox homologous domain [Pseudocohnilembus persalinus]|eukprot:KRX09015.1 Phox homologous domain [Pseudocohnilembus persalinus]
MEENQQQISQDSNQQENNQNQQQEQQNEVHDQQQEQQQQEQQQQEQNQQEQQQLYQQEQEQQQQVSQEEQKQNLQLTQPQSQNKGNDTFHLDEFFEDDGFPINVAVTDPSIKEGVSKYILYCVKGEDKQGVFEVYRRFSDFYALRQALCTRWPGVFIPPIPPKKATGNFDAFFISERRQLFEKFLSELSKLKFLWYEQEFQTFLRSPHSDIEKALSNLPKFYYEDTINKYQNVFRSLQGKILSQELDEKIQSFTLFLKKIKDQLIKFKDQMKVLMNSRQMYDVEFDKFISFLLPQYELTCLKEYVGNIVEGKFVFAEQTEPKINNLLQELRDMTYGSKLKELYLSIKQEIYEIEAFIEAVGYVTIYENNRKTEESKVKTHEKELAKAESGKKSLFSNKSSEQKVQEQNMKIEFHQSMLDKVNQILDLIKVITGYISVEKFKKAELWSYVLENDNLTSFEITK